MIDIHQINFEKLNGLIPVCIQDSQSLEVLMIGFMNQQALEITIETGKVTFWSRTKNRLWVKGEASGNYLELLDIYLDCDDDSLLISVRPIGPTCHKGYKSCFGDQKSHSLSIINKLIDIIEDRFRNAESESYTSNLFAQGVKRIAQKVGEEGIEVALSAVSGEPNALKDEIADLIFHLLVLMQNFEIKLIDIANILKNRMGHKNHWRK
jgi:phosphoribosyl-ATP pyrophosphohydrolase/phosphoribosyl-AMP cyclohydrolase